jgi:outer membrane protein assembly factor BamB
MFSYGDIGIETRFGPSQPGGAADQLYFGMDLRGDPHLYAFSLDGQQRWAIPVGPNAAGAEPAIGSDGTVYSTDFIASGLGWVIRAFEPAAGNPLWLYDGDFNSSVSHLDIDAGDNLYYVTDLAFLESFDARSQTLRWSNNTGDVLDRPSVSPDGSIVVASGVPTFGEPGFIKGFDAANGSEIWSIPLPGAYYPAPRWSGTDRPRFAPDSRTVYVSTSMIAGDLSDPYATLFAIALARAGDVDGDGDVDLGDLALLLSAFGTCDGDPGFNAAADVDSSGCVELADLAVLLSEFGT